MAKKVLNYDLSEPLNRTTAAKMYITPGDGNLIIDNNTGGAQVLASGTLQYLEDKGLPTCTVDTDNGKVTLTLKASGGGQSWFRLPWAGCNGATEWQVHLNPGVKSDITAHSDGGNIKIDLSKMALTGLSADTGGGNIDMILPGKAANLNVAAKSGAGNVTIEFGSGTTGSNIVDANSGAGNVTVLVPASMAARIHASSGMGKVIVDSRFSQIDKNTYQSPDYDDAANKVEITLKSGAGNASVETK